MTPSLQQAIFFHKKGDLVQAEHFYARAVGLEPSNAMAQHFFATLRLQQGRFAEAVTLCDRAIALNSRHAEAHNNRAIALCNLQNFEAAVLSFDAALAAKPNAIDVLFNRGQALLRLGRFEAALSSLNRALAIKPKYPEALSVRGVVQSALRRFDEALASYDAALALLPRHPETMYNRGIALMELSRHDEAIAAFGGALALKPDYADALNNRGMAFQRAGRVDEALADFARAAVLQPTVATVFYNRGVLLRELGRYEEAVASQERAIGLQPDNVNAWNERGLAQKHLKRYADALASFDRVVALDPQNSVALNSRGAALWEMGQIDEAEESFSRAIAIDPNFAMALHNRGGMIWSRRRAYDPALRDLEKATALDPNCPFALGDLAHVKMYGGDWAGYDACVAQLDAGVRAGKRVVMPFAYQAISQSLPDLQACARIYDKAHVPAAPAIFRKSARRPGKIRVGYVCGEFRDHATCYLSVGLYEKRDKTRFEITAFDAGGSDGSPMRARLEAAFDKFISIAGLDGRQAAERVAAEDIDILVNLNGYYGIMRMDLFSHRPAPVQVNFLGFPGTLGANYIDYIIADPVVIKDGEQDYFDEKVVHLPVSYQVNDDKRIAPEVAVSRAEHGLPDGAFVFCHFNYNYKLTPATFALWMRILRHVEGSIFWLLQSSEPFAEHLRHEAAAHGVAAERIVFAPVLDYPKHLARLPLGDLFLDSLPYNAHTTGSDALWMGLPLLTQTGSAFAGRVAASLLQAVGLPELVTHNAEDFEALAVKLAREPELLTAIRQKLARAHGDAPLFDTARYARHLETAYVRMMETWERGETARSFNVEDK